MYISTGSFIIRGKRNFLQPQKLELGFTLMFCISEESLANHIGERNPREDVTQLESETRYIEQASNTEPLVESEIDKLLRSKDLKTQASFAAATGDNYDDEKITIVQVGEREKNFTEQKNGKHMKVAKD